jgi:hypothetical protein
LAKGINGFLAQLDGSSEVSLPDVAARNNTKGENNFGGFYSLDNIVNLGWGTIKIDVKTSYRKLGDERDIRVKATEVRREHDLGSDWGKVGVGSGELLVKGSCTVENENGLINLNPLCASGLEVSQELLVDGEDAGEERYRLETGLGVLRRLGEDKERDRAENNRTRLDTRSLGFGEFLDSLIEVQLEFGILRQFGNHKVVVGVKPKTTFPKLHKRFNPHMYLPLLHLGSRHVDVFSLSSTSHGEINVQRRQSQADITFRNNVECGGVIEDVVVKGKFTAIIGFIDVSDS